MTGGEFEDAVLDLMGPDAADLHVHRVLRAAESAASYGKVLAAVASGQRVIEHMARVAREQREARRRAWSAAAEGSGGRA